jgi:prepilin-type N-terminal cleavage/methylation domain-containing protein
MKKGFTLIELLVVIGIIALLSTLSVVALSSARAKSRDARRVSDIRQIRTALEMYLDGASPNAYPDEGDTTTLGVTSTACLTSNGWTTTAGCTSGTVYMADVPTDPLSARAYVYGVGTSNATYTITYNTEVPDQEVVATENSNN